MSLSLICLSCDTAKPSFLPNLWVHTSRVCLERPQLPFTLGRQWKYEKILFSHTCVFRKLIIIAIQKSLFNVTQIHNFTNVFFLRLSYKKLEVPTHFVGCKNTHMFTDKTTETFHVVVLYESYSTTQKFKNNKQTNE